LGAIFEGEALLNDGAAIVVYKIFFEASHSQDTLLPKHDNYVNPLVQIKS